MGPDQIAIVGNVLAILKMMSGWPFGFFLFLFIVGPWVLALLLAYAQKKRFESVVRMYESNVDLVKKYEDVAQNLKDVVIMNTTAITRIVDRIDGMNTN